MTDSRDKTCTTVQTKCQAPEGVSRQCFRRRGNSLSQQKASSLAAQHGESHKAKMAEAVNTNTSRPGRGTFCLGRQSEWNRREAEFNSHLPEGLWLAQLGNSGSARSPSLWPGVQGRSRVSGSFWAEGTELSSRRTLGGQPTARRWGRQCHIKKVPVIQRTCPYKVLSVSFNPPPNNPIEGTLLLSLSFKVRTGRWSVQSYMGLQWYSGIRGQITDDSCVHRSSSLPVSKHSPSSASNAWPLLPEGPPGLS